MNRISKWSRFYFLSFKAMKFLTKVNNFGFDQSTFFELFFMYGANMKAVTLFVWPLEVAKMLIANNNGISVPRKSQNGSFTEPI